jgi:hypothetical protein
MHTIPLSPASASSSMLLYLLGTPKLYRVEFGIEISAAG